MVSLGVIHTASPFVLDAEDNKRDILDPAIQGSLAILEAAKTYGPSVKRIVSTSSFASILDLSEMERSGKNARIDACIRPSTRPSLKR